MSAMTRMGKEYQKKKPSAVAGKVSFLFRGLSWSLGPNGKNTMFDQEGHRLEPRAGRTYFFLVVFFAGFFAGAFFATAFFAMALVPPFYD